MMNSAKTDELGSLGVTIGTACGAHGGAGRASLIKIAPSILAADFLRLGEQIIAVDRAGADRIHIDIMDGQFVPNISLGIPIVEAVRRATSLPLEAHLMIQQPERYVETFAKAGTDNVIVHQETSPHLDRTIQLIKGLGKKVGVGLNPSTPAITLDEVLEDLDLVLVMTVNPGFGGQRFIEHTLKKISQVRVQLDSRNPDCDLEVDGGIDAETATRAVEAGANVLVAGTSIFACPDGPEAGTQRIFKAVS
ncbi:MAG TPA: ribulose-phosphate 3-epimerase [Blastocatellia bacterium]|nr:ribulose-phosphate 3-epimerase [Blastocatellia bacterium]